MKLHYILSRTLCSGLCGEWNILPVSFKRTFSALSSNAVLINQEVDKFDVANKSNVAPLQKDSIDWKWQSSKTVVQCKYKNGKGMLPVEVNVFDNHLGSDAPTVVMLLGLSGSGDDFKDMVTFLSSAGIRCVAPEIPGFGDSEISRSDIYRLDFTSAGQSQMLIDILKEIDVGRAMRPYAWTKLVGATARKEKLWPIADSYINIGARRSGFKIPQHKKRQMFVSLETVSTVDFDLVKQDAKTIQEKRLPAFVAWSQNDKMIEESLTRHLLSLLDVQENVSTKPQSRYTKEVVFNNGGHVLHRKQAKSLSENIISMLQQIL
ncbi:uncharacterized protein LOC125681504 isoform X2 [Ostrea edulis]|uniref:uncharacterized protein LOC125681504 isoform X2 n=1 Tax=Ostrea edulis TaxID=37623 RepID=UPI0024AE99B2|nr:uncharacterized protein LOC125681504 isoform X2 [Ostrea edulis]